MHRRSFLQRAATASAAAWLPVAGPAAAPDGLHGLGPHLRTSCNLYSFNAPLRSGALSLEEVIRYCAELGFDAVDPTAYYLSTYPAVPPDEYLYGLKNLCCRLGLDISGTGVRNDFTVDDADQRARDVSHVQAWIDAAAKLGVPLIRVFSGRTVPPAAERARVESWVAEAFEACVAYGAQRGVIVAVQIHADFLHTADHVLRLLDRIDSKWFGVILDIDGFRDTDTWADVEALIPHAVSWQVKEWMTVDGERGDTDYPRLLSLIRENGYRGYLPLETLGEGDPRVKVRRMIEVLRPLLG